MNRSLVRFVGQPILIMIVGMLNLVESYGNITVGKAPSATAQALWYGQPARNWETGALPIGNGRLGAMLFGGAPKERIQFNEESLWIGDENETGA